MLHISHAKLKGWVEPEDEAINKLRQLHFIIERISFSELSFLVELHFCLYVDLIVSLKAITRNGFKVIVTFKRKSTCSINWTSRLASYLMCISEVHSTGGILLRDNTVCNTLGPLIYDPSNVKLIS